MIILEYNEKKKSFYYNDIIDDVPIRKIGSYGYSMLTLFDNYEYAHCFCAFLWRQFIDRGVFAYSELKFATDNLLEFLLCRDALKK